MSHRRRVFLIFGALLLVVVLGVGGWVFAIVKGLWPPPGTELRTGIVFGQGGGQELRLNFVRPKKAAGKMPVLLFIHGGGWRGGKKEEFHPFMFHFSRSGIFCATVDYRLAPTHRFPAQIEDVKCAVRWLRANADRHQLDPARIVAFGGSAGAHLAALLAVTEGRPELEGIGGNPAQSSTVRAAICLAGPYDLTLGYRSSVRQRQAERDAVRQLLPALLGGTPDEMPEIYRWASPITYASADSPPMLLVHGTADPLVLLEQAEVFAKRLQDAGAPVQFLPLPEGTHTNFGKDADQAVKTIVNYTLQQLGVPQAR
jgi:acetyl esterase/lipase